MAKNTRRAWFQGADQPSVDGEVTSNDPNKLGYPKEMGYNKKPMETTAPGGQDTRPWEQKWFEGAAAETKKVMGPQGSEFKLKQEMQRIPMDAKVANAKLSGKFTVASSPKNSYWSIFATDKKTGKKEKVLTATLEQLWGKDLNEELAYATKGEDYIKEVMSRIREEGFSNVAYLMTGDKSFVRKAGGIGEAAGTIGGAGIGFMAGGPVGALVGAGAGKALMSDDNLELTVEDAAGEDATRADVTVEELEAKKAELEGAESKLIDLLPADAADLGREVQALEAEVETAIEENKTVAAKLRDKSISASAKVKLMKIAQEAFEAAAEETLPAADNALADLAAKIDEVVASVDEITEGADAEGGEELQGAPVAEEGADLEGAGADLAGAGEGMEEAGEEMELTSSQIKKFLNKRSEMNKAAMTEEQKYGVVPDGAPKDGKDEIKSAHPKGGTQVPDLTAGGPVKNDGALFETVTEAQDVDLAVANKMPTGELNSSASSKARVKTASADSATSSYWHELFDKMGPEGKKFADQLTDSYSKQVSAATEEIRGRVKRAYELAELASTKGLVEPSTSAKSALADRIQKFDDEAFVAYKEAVENTPTRRITASETLTKTSSKVPMVGQNDKSIAGGDEFEKLSRIWS
jgi:hypothetical protein